MIRTILLSTPALVISTCLSAVPARAEVGEVRDRSTAMELVQVQSGRYGPYATLRRANEVANYFQSLGFNAWVFYGGTLDDREYYVDVQGDDNG